MVLWGSLCLWYDFNADPGVIPCLAKGISSGQFVDLVYAVGLGIPKVDGDSTLLG